MTEQDVLMRVPEDKRQKYCQFYLGKERHCQATTMDSCKGCRFFAPTFNSRMKIMMNFINTQERENLRIAKNLAEAKEVIAWLRGEKNETHITNNSLDHVTPVAYGGRSDRDRDDLLRRDEADGILPML